MNQNTFLDQNYRSSNSGIKEAQLERWGIIEPCFINIESLEGSFIGDSFRWFLRLLLSQVCLGLNHATLIRDFNENCHITLNELHPGEVRTHAQRIQRQTRYRCAIEELVQKDEEYVKIWKIKFLSPAQEIEKN